MEAFIPNKSSFNRNLFGDEEKNKHTLKQFLSPVGFNNTKEIDPWDDNLKMKD